jgi:hypothetical protein
MQRSFVRRSDPGLKPVVREYFLRRAKAYAPSEEQRQDSSADCVSVEVASFFGEKENCYS